jgi:hypothetical protein
LLDNAVVLPDERLQAESIGLDLVESEDQMTFALPCPRFAGDRCSVYANRPGVCRSFRCKLLDNVADGQVEASEARTWISQTRALTTRIRAQFPEAKTPLARKALWDRLQEEWRADASSVSLNRQAMLDLATLDQVLSRWFRRAKSD